MEEPPVRHDQSNNQSDLNLGFEHWNCTLDRTSTKILVPFDFLQDFCQILRIPGPLKLTSWALVLCSIIIGPLNHKLVSFLVPVPCHCWLSIATRFFCLQNKSDSWRFGKVRVCSPDRNLYQNTWDQNTSPVITVKSILIPFRLLKFHQNMKHSALLPHQLLLLQKSRKLHWSFSCRLSLLMKSKAKHKFFYSVCQPSIILGSSFQQFQSFLRPWNLLENNFWKGR